MYGMTRYFINRNYYLVCGDGVPGGGTGATGTGAGAGAATGDWAGAGIEVTLFSHGTESG